MEEFRHNLKPVEVKKFLKNTADLTEGLLIRYCYKAAVHCPQCKKYELCQSGAVSLYSSRMDKITHEISFCLKCGYTKMLTVLTIESL